MRILLLACLSKNKANNSFGGAEKSIINLANWLSHEDKIDVTLVSVEGNERSFQIGDRVSFEGHEFEHKNKVQIHRVIRKNTINAVRKYKPDIVISFWIQPLFYLALSKVGKKCKFIYSERNDPHREYGKVARIMRKIVTNSAVGIVFQTNAAKNYFSSKVREKSIVIHNPVYIGYNDYPPLSYMDNRIVAVGRLNNQKNYPLLIEGFCRIADMYPELVLEIYGEGPLRKEIQNLIDSSNCANRINLMGAYPDVIERINGARLFVMTSNYEGMPNALMEAMCLGIPVICSDCPCGGPKELIQNGYNGFLFRNGDVNDLVDKLQIALSMSENDLTRISNREKEICNTHSNDYIFGMWKDYISKCLKK